MLSKDDAFEEWLDRNWEVLGGLLVCLGEKKMRSMIVKFNATVIAAIIARAGIELAGSSLAYAIDGKAGMDSWVEYSNGVFGDTTWFPNPVAVAESVIVSEQKIKDHYGFHPDVYLPHAMKGVVSSTWHLLTSRKRQLRFVRSLNEY